MSNKLPLIVKNFIRCEYSMRAEILTNICNHIDNLNRDSIVHHTSRTKLMNKLNTSVLTLNNNYNKSLHCYKSIDYNPSPIEQKFIDDGNFDAYQRFMSSGDTKLRTKVIEYFSNDDIELYELMNVVGSKSISD